MQNCLKCKFFFLTISSFVICLLCTCNKTIPISNSPCIEAQPDTIFVLQPFYYISCNYGASYYRWDLGDTIAYARWVQHFYSTAGTYPSSLTVTVNGTTQTQYFTTVAVNNSAGYYFFDSALCYPNTCSISSSKINAIVGGISQSAVQSTLSIQFPSAAIPASGTYTVVRPGGQVLTGTVSIDFNGLAVQSNNYAPHFISTGGNGTEKINISTGNNGKLNVVGSNIEMQNVTFNNDSVQLSINISQTQ